jgi:hypothetical protein
MSSNHILGNPVNAVTPALVCVVMWSTVASGFKLGLSSFAVEQLLLLGTVVSWLVFFGYAAATNLGSA